MKQIPGLARAFGQTLAELRARRGLSQEKLAEMIDATNVHISMLETGQRQPSLNALLLLADALDEPPEEIVVNISKLLKQMADS